MPPHPPPLPSPPPPSPSPPPPPSPPPRPSYPPGTMPFHVLLLAGQSNMEGHGVATSTDGRPGDLATNEEFSHWKDPTGSWAAREDVLVWYDESLDSAPGRHGNLTVGFGSANDGNHFGIELELGRALGDRFEGPVLLVKTAWGGKSIRTDLRPPSAGGEVGPYFMAMIDGYKRALAYLESLGTGYAPKLEGFVWWQGWNDLCCGDEYLPLLTMLIADVRAELGDATLPVVIGGTGNGDPTSDREALLAAQEGAAQAVGHAIYVPTRQHLQAPDQSPHPTHLHHWYGNAASYLRIGRDMGAAALSLIRSSPSTPPSSSPPGSPPPDMPWADCTAAELEGDFNGQSGFTLSDAIHVARQWTGKAARSACMDSMDLDQSGSFDLADAIFVAKVWAGVEAFAWTG